MKTFKYFLAFSILALVLNVSAIPINETDSSFLEWTNTTIQGYASGNPSNFNATSRLINNASYNYTINFQYNITYTSENLSFQFYPPINLTIKPYNERYNSGGYNSFNFQFINTTGRGDFRIFVWISDIELINNTIVDTNNTNVTIPENNQTNITIPITPEQPVTAVSGGSGGSAGSGCITTWLNCTTKADYVRGNVKIAGKYCYAPIKDKPNCTIIENPKSFNDTQEQGLSQNAITNPVPVDIPEKKSYTWIFVVLGIIILMVIVGWFVTREGLP